MTTQPEALRLADSISRIDTLTDHQRRELLHAAAELRRLSAVEAQRDALLRILKSELQHAEWQDKIIYPVGSEEFQNWKLSIYLPVPLSASDRSPEAALTRAVDAAIKAVEGETK